MKKTNKIIIGVILIAVMLLGIGYAAIQNITLNISGTAKADPSQSNFKVMFTGTPTVSDSSKVVAAITNDTNATINVSGLTAKGQTVTATYTVQNVSSDLSADLSVATTNSNTEYFTLKAELAKTSLVAGEATTLTVTVILTKTPVSETVSSTIGIQLTATPVEPGQEGTSGSTNGSSQTPSAEGTLAMLTNANIGDYIDLGNNIVGTSSTSDDWRVLYVEDDTVYAILADYLPANQIPSVSGLYTDTDQYEYSVWSETDRDTLINGLKNTVAWRSFANGISGAIVNGSPDVELIIKSYNYKNSTELVSGDSNLKLDSETKDYDLYVPHTESLNGNEYGYWTVSESTTDGDIDYTWTVMYDGNLIYFSPYNYSSCEGYWCSRPVVALSNTTKASLENGVWKLSK